ncbi:PREDICTED: serine protease inhibitor dipetalogastin-like, partial [Priapulus caudatus]|uniref:Serine protease inhibitor dipetalogastin-like n=1 Tax=Priapulus caudatus TaxID=37621 RepID=A0ABM1EQI4_PRICU
MYATRGLHLAIHGYRLLACLILVSTSFGQQLGDVTGCICLEPYNQICGSDGITYANQCHLNCIALLTPGLQKAKNGPCQQDDTNTNFAVPDDPVLDSFSLDSLEPQQVLGSSAACDVACVGVPDEPVCGNNHKTYRNKCDLQCAATMNSETPEIFDTLLRSALTVLRTDATLLTNTSPRADLRPGYPGACR